MAEGIIRLAGTTDGEIIMGEAKCKILEVLEESFSLYSPQ